MISIETQFTGGQIANAMHGENEELAYFLEGLAENIDGDDAKEIKDHLPFGKAQEIAGVLPLLADSFDPEEAAP